MKKFLILIIVTLVLLFVYQYDPLNGTGGEDAFVKPGQTEKPLALVTGSSRGIGAALAKLLDEKGYRMIIHGRNEQRLATVASELHNPQIVVADLATEQGREKMIDVIKTQSPQLVVNNAGLTGSRYARGAVLKNDVNVYSTMIEVNCNALMELTYVAAQTMSENKIKGIVLNVSSVASNLAPLPGMTVYSATKSFVTDFSVGLDFELAGTGIRVLTSKPGTVATIPKRIKKKSIMRASEAAEEMYSQIENRKTTFTFSRRFRIFTMLNKVIPHFISIRMKSTSGMSDKND